MADDKNKKTDAAMAKPGQTGFDSGPVRLHDQDDCVFEVVWPEGVLENGRMVPKGELITLKRAHALAQNIPGRPLVYRLVKTIRHIHGPGLTYEGVEATEPLAIS